MDQPAWLDRPTPLQSVWSRALSDMTFESERLRLIRSTTPFLDKLSKYTVHAPVHCNELAGKQQKPTETRGENFV